MAIEIDSINDLQKHIEGVVSRANHHALTVNNAVFSLIGLIIWKAKIIKARTSVGKNANQIWFNTEKGNRYSVVFSHTKNSILIRDKTQQGDLLLSVDNATPFEDMLRFFESI